MEHWIFWGIGVLLVVGMVLILGAPSDVRSSYEVVITKIKPVGDDEIVWIKNLGDEPVDLSGWQLYTPPYYRFTFPQGCILAPGAELKLHSGPQPKIFRRSPSREGEVCYPGVDLLWTLQHVWCDQNGDTAYLYDSQGNLVDKYEYGAGWHVSSFVPCDRAGEEERTSLR